MLCNNFSALNVILQVYNEWGWLFIEITRKWFIQGPFILVPTSYQVIS